MNTLAICFLPSSIATSYDNTILKITSSIKTKILKTIRYPLICLIILISSLNLFSQKSTFIEPIYVDGHHIQLLFEGVYSIIVEYHRFPDSNLGDLLDHIHSKQVIPDSSSLLWRKIAHYKNDTLKSIKQFSTDFDKQFRRTSTKKVELKNGYIHTQLATNFNGNPSCCFSEKYKPYRKWLKKISSRMYSSEEKKPIRISSISDKNYLKPKFNHSSFIDSLIRTDSLIWHYSYSYLGLNNEIIGNSYYFDKVDEGFLKVSVLKLKKNVIDIFTFDKNSELIGRAYKSVPIDMNNTKERSLIDKRSYILRNNEKGHWTTMIWNKVGITTRKIFYK